MFNSNTIYILILSILLYTVQTFIFLLILNIFTKKNEGINAVAVNIPTKHISNLVLILILSYAGLPPFFMFFFKILIFIKLNFSTWLIILYIIINSLAVYYYINFFSKFSLNTKKNNIFKHKIILEFIINNILHIIFFSLMICIFFIYANVLIL